MKAITHKQLADAYGVNGRTLSRWIKKLNIFSPNQSNRMYTPAQVEVIFKKLGTPESEQP